MKTIIYKFNSQTIQTIQTIQTPQTEYKKEPHVNRINRTNRKNIRKYIILAKGYILININTTSINFKKEIRTLFIPPKIWPLRLSLSIIGMITINSQEIRYFYRKIVKSGNVYRIKYNNKDYGEFKKLSDALYERDALFYCNFEESSASQLVKMSSMNGFYRKR